MNKRRLLARIVVYVLSVVLVFWAAPVVVSSSATRGNPSATISPQNHVFPSAVVGYGQQAAQVFTITNTGDMNLFAVPGGGWSGHFTGDGWGFRELIRPGESLALDLRPNTSLPVGTHTGELIGLFLPASDWGELDRIEEGAGRLFHSAIANYLGITLEILDAWSDAEWNAFWDESAGFYNSPIGRQWEESNEAYWRSVGQIELRAALSFTVTAPTAAPDTAPNSAPPADDTAAEPNYNQPLAVIDAPDDDVNGQPPHTQAGDINDSPLNPNLNPPTGR